MAILLVHDYAMVLSTKMSDLGSCGHYVLGSLISSRIVLQQILMVSHSRLLIVIGSGYFFFRVFNILRTMEVDHSTQCQKLSSRK